MAIKADICVFAHDEAAGIAAMVAGLRLQDLSGIDARIVILANGCTDDTAALARAAAAGSVVDVVELAEGGKSRSWNRFVHGIARPDAEVLVFADADIRLPAPDCLSRLIRGLVARPALWALNSQPVKDIVAVPQQLSLTDRLIAAAGGGLDDWKTAICGQLYAMPAARARRFHLPVGLPVEDGFLRAMVLTDALTGPEDFSRIDGLEGLAHIYESERSIGRLIRHQERIVIGSAINAAAFAALRDLPPEDRAEELATAARDDGWLPSVIAARLPAAPGGYVPLHFLTKRLMRAFTRPLQARRLAVALPGFAFDLIVYLRAQYRMAKGAGAGFW
ncbi:MAG: glycosyltransferase [Rhodobacteraceae bacterium]|nr:glycosyltransferase [Paracoccaceae bacterium]